jgi:Transcriptional regulators containing a DNA-binding HTH domain and an aminotransferase domain (MocR family) and their eukaryotic orthologs
MLGIVLDRKSEAPLRRQIYTALKARMMDGRLAAGEALPSTRELARQLNVSRNTACEAYEMLIAEGFALSHTGAATRVAPGLCLNRTVAACPPERSVKAHIDVDFQTGRPDLMLFPHFAFAQALGSAARQTPPSQLGYTGPQGLPALRTEISAWLLRSRGILAGPEDIFISAGATHALHMIGDLLYRPEGRMLVEDPCHTGLLQTFLDRGYQTLPVEADRHGIRTELLTARDIRAIYVTPSHQFRWAAYFRRDAAPR